jgi:hypothetical protein
MTNQEGLQALQRIQAKLLGVTHAIDLFELQEKEMALDPKITAVIQAIDTATNDIAARIQKLIDAAANAGTLTSDEIAAALQPEVDKLTALGKDPNNPVP